MNKLRVALIGAGGMGMCHYNAYKGIDDMELVAVWAILILDFCHKTKFQYVMKDSFKL